MTFVGLTCKSSVSCLLPSEVKVLPVSRYSKIFKSDLTDAFVAASSSCEQTEQRGGGGGESLRGFYGSVKRRRRMRENESDGGDGGALCGVGPERRCVV